MKNKRKYYGLKFRMLMLALILLTSIQASAAGITSPSKIVTSGQNFDLNITLDPMGTPISGAQLNLAFNKSLLKINSITEGNFFKQKGANTFFNGGNINNSTGTVMNIFNVILGKSNVSTPGTFIQVNMTFIGSSGISFINLSNTKISDINALPVSHNVINGSISTVQPLYLTVFESPDPVSSGSSSQVTVHVGTTGNAHVAGSLVNIAATGGSLTSTSGVTDSNGDFKSTYYAPAVSTKTTYTISATVSKAGYSNSSGSDIITVDPPSVVPDIIFSDDFESGTSKWTYSGLWHVSPMRYNSPIQGARYGQESSGNYNTGKANSGYLSSTAISLVGSTSPKLSFMSWYNTESGMSYDKKIVQISTDNGITWINLKQISDAQSTWNLETVNLSTYAGKIIMIRFYFDTVDSLYNNYEGWYIDDLKIENGAPVSPNPAQPLYLTIFESPDPVSSGSSSQVTVHVGTTGNAHVAGSLVNIAATGGSLTSTSGVTDSNGYFKSTYYAPAVSTKPTYTISATVSKAGYSNSSGSDIITVDPPSVVPDIIFSDDFESGTSKWTYSGLWHVTTKRYSTPNHGARYGQESSGNYNTGKTNSGYLSSTAISLVGSTNPKLSFMSWYNTESGMSYDKKIVQISTDNGITWINLKQISDAQSTWNLETIDLSGYSGKTIKIRFYFDTVDGLYNNYEGWYIDDIKIAIAS